MFYQGHTFYWTYFSNRWSDWYEMKRRCISWILGELCDLDLWPHPWPWPFKVKVVNSLIWGISCVCVGRGGWRGGGGGGLPWSERNVSRSFMTVTVTYGKPWWGGWMLIIVTRVTSDVGVPSTYLVHQRDVHCTIQRYNTHMHTFHPVAINVVRNYILIHHCMITT